MFNENYTESQTREKIIDKLLIDAGWDIDDRSQVIPEFEVKGAAGFNFRAAQKDKGRDVSGFSDYLLLDRKGEPLAVIEAKKTSRDPIAGKRQAEDYADGIKNETGI
ncbi:MAG: type I restriction endonuclease subunit R, partial [Candidatus Margulisiibacteriota bacterium]